jgi:DnaK suppressor protein
MDRGKKALSGVGGGAITGKSPTKDKRSTKSVAKPAMKKSAPDKNRSTKSVAKPATQKSPPDKKRPVATAAKGKALAGGKPAQQKGSVKETQKSLTKEKRPAHGVAKPATQKSPPDKKRAVEAAAKGKERTGGKPTTQKGSVKKKETQKSLAKERAPETGSKSIIQKSPAREERIAETGIINHEHGSGLMNKERLEYFKRKLLKQREAILDKAKKLKEYSYTLGTDGIQDMADAASNAYNADILMSLSDNERNMVKEIDSALDKIANGTYGICEECDEPINEKRLEANPVARYCITCKRMIEEKGI